MRLLLVILVLALAVPIVESFKVYWNYAPRRQRPEKRVVMPYGRFSPWQWKNSAPNVDDE